MNEPGSSERSTDGRTEIENHHLTTTMVITVFSKNHQHIQKTLRSSKSLRVNNSYTVSHKILTNYEGKNW